MKIRFSTLPLAIFALSTALCSQIASAQTAKPMTMYFIDTEGGHSTLYISPTGQSILEDTGFTGDRDHAHVMAALADAGIKELDYLVVTHYHVDHIGGVESLAGAIPIKHFVDHGPSVEEREQVANFQAMYKGLYEKVPGSHMVVKPGDKLPFGSVNVEVVTSAGEAIKKPMAGAPGAGKPNPECANFKKIIDDRTPENSQSVGLVYSYGKFRTINLGDWVYNDDPKMMCPNNPIGTVDLYLTSNHGSDQSASAVLVHALEPRVAIFDNGSRKGGAAQSFDILHTSPGLQDIWQLHYSVPAGLENNSAGAFIANVEEPATLAAALLNPQPAGGAGGRGASGAAGGAVAGGPGGGGPGGAGRGAAGASGGRGGGGGAQAHTPAYWLKVTALPDGSFTVLNPRNKFSKTYGPHKN